MESLPAQRILLIRPGTLGDVCCTVPLLVSLRYAYPDAEIDWLIQDGFQDAIRAHPALSKAVPFHQESLAKAFRRGRFDEFVPWLEHLRSHKYEMVIDAQGLFRTGLAAYLSGAGVRIGHRAAGECAWVFYTDRERGSAGRHTVDRALALSTAAGAEEVLDLTLRTPPEEAEEVVFDTSLGSRFAVFAPTTSWPGKRWPAERFDAVAKRLLDHDFVGRIVIVGGPGEESQCGPLIERAQYDNRLVNLVGRTSVGRLMALIECSALVLTNDSPALHMAVGFERPLVALFGPTPVEQVGPYEREADVIECVTTADRLGRRNTRSGQAMMSRITIDQVLQACVARLSAPR